MSAYTTPPPPLFKPSSAAAVVLPPTHPSSDGNSTTSHQSETAPSPSTNDNAATPPLRPPPPPPPKHASFPARDDCWSEDATFTLIEAWGDRFVQLNRGNLRQKDWQQVADAVNARHGFVKKARRSDIQCKNRIDTLKKKYKPEKTKVLQFGANNYVSPWPFFAPLDLLIGDLFKPSPQSPTPPPQQQRKRPSSVQSPPSLPALPPPSSVPVGRRSKRPAPPAYRPSSDKSFFRRNFSVMAAAAAAIDGADDNSDSDFDFDSGTSWCNGGNGNWCRNRFEKRRRFSAEKKCETSGDPYRKLAEAIGKFAEVYARVEEAKQRQMIELEKQRMQFTKDLELQRLKILMESQVQLEKLRRLNSNPEPDFRRMDEEDVSTSIN